MSTRLAVLFVAALTGVLAAVGLALAALGPLVLGGYVLLVVVGLVLLLRQARAVRAQQQQAEGRTCTCCATTVFDPVEVR